MIVSFFFLLIKERDEGYCIAVHDRRKRRVPHFFLKLGAEINIDWQNI